MEGKAQRNRSVSERSPRSAVSSGLPGAGGPFDSGRRQRGARLAGVGGPCPGTDRQGADALRGGGLGDRLGKHSLRAGLDDGRSVLDALSVGAFSSDEGGDQDAHSARSARPHSHLYSRHRLPVKATFSGSTS